MNLEKQLIESIEGLSKSKKPRLTARNKLMDILVFNGSEFEKILNKCSISWKFFVISVLNHDKMEIDANLDASQSSTTFNKIPSLLFHVLNLQYKNGNQSALKKVIHHITEHLSQNPCTVNFVAKEYLQILDTRILSNHKLCCETTRETWNKLYQCMCSLQSDPPQNLLNEVSRVFLRLVEWGYRYSTLPASLLLAHLSPVLSGLQDHTKLHFIHVITAFNLITQYSGVNCRELVCKIGEEIFDSFRLFLINFKFDQITAQLLKFFILQFHYHHPSDFIETKYVTESWMRSVNKLHQIMLELFQVQQNNIFSKSSFLYNISQPRFLYHSEYSLISQLLFDLLVQLIRSFNLIELKSPNLALSVSSVPKKVKLSSSNFLELLSEHLSLGFNHNILAFVHLLRILLDRLPDLFKGHISDIIKRLCEIVSTSPVSFIHDITLEVVLCFISILTNPDLIQEGSTKPLLITSISNHLIQLQKQPLYYKLLALCLEMDHQLKLPIVWSELQLSLSFAKTQCIRFLWQYISIRDLPSYKDIYSKNPHSPHNNRMCILNCLLPDRIDSKNIFQNWLTSCDHFFMLGQILASLSMRSCRKSIELTKQFFTDSSLRNHNQTQESDLISDNVINIMLELECLPFSPKPMPPDLELYTTKRIVIPYHYTEYIDRTAQIFLNTFTQLTSSDITPDNKAIGLISLLKYFFYFQFNFIVWSSYHTNPSTPRFQGELTALILNQYCECVMQSPSLGSILRLEEFLMELRSISVLSGQNKLYSHSTNYAIHSLLECFPNSFVNHLKSHIFDSYSTLQKRREQKCFIPQDSNPFHVSVLNKSREESFAIVRAICNLHWLSHQLNSNVRDSLENFLVGELLSTPLHQLYFPCNDGIFVLQADFMICEYFATSNLECSQDCLTSILQILLVTCIQLHKFNPMSIYRIISILTSLAHKLVKYIQSDHEIPNLVANLLRILTQMYLSSRLTSQNKSAFIELIFLFYDISSDTDWRLLTLQVGDSQEKIERTLKVLLYELNSEFDGSCVTTYAKSIGKLHNGCVKDLDYHLSAFFNVTKCMSECNLPTFLEHHLTPISQSETAPQHQLRFVNVLLIRLALSSNKLSSSVVALMLSFSLEKGVENELIVRGLSRISDGLAYSDLSAFFTHNYESVFVEWLCLGLPVHRFPFELFGITEEQYVDSFVSKWMPFVLLSNDDETNAQLMQMIPQVGSNEELLRYSFSEISCLLLLSNSEDFQFPSSVLKSNIAPFSILNIPQAIAYISKFLPLNSRKKLLVQNLESTLLIFFLKCISSCSTIRRREIEAILPSFFGVNMDISFMNEAFKMNFKVSLLSLFESDPYLLPGLHISILKELKGCVQPYQFIHKFYSYCTFLQFVSVHSSPTFETLTFLLNDPVYIIFDLLQTRRNIYSDNSIEHIRWKFSSSINNQDTLTLLHTLISIYESVLPHIPDLVLNTVSFLTDILCDYACSANEDVSSLALHSLGNILSEITNPKAFIILIFIPANPVLASLKSSIEDGLGEYNKVEILRELAVNSWYSQMSCMAYLNQVKLYLTWFISTGNVKLYNVNELNLLFDQLIQKIRFVTSSDISPNSEISITLFEIFVLLTPYYNRSQLAVESKSLYIYSRHLKLHHNLYHLPILLYHLSQLIHSSDIPLKEHAYNILKVISNTYSVQSVIESLGDASELAYSSFPFTLGKKSKNLTKFARSTMKTTSYNIPFEVPNENTIENTKNWLKDLCLHLVDYFVQDPILISTRTIIPLHHDSGKELLKLFVYDVILGENSEAISVLSDHFNTGFRQAFDSILHHNSNENNVNMYAIRILLELMHFLRRKSLFDNSPRAYFKNNFLLKVSHLYAASSSFLCKDYHSTLLFLHIYSDPLRTQYLTLPQIPGEELVIQELLIKTYGELGEIECVNSVACNSLDLEFQKAKMTGNWPEVVQMCGSFPFNKVTSTLDLCEAMHRMGWYSFSLQHASDTGDYSLSELNYESVWRLSLWDDSLPEVLSTNPAEPSPQQIIFETIQAFKERDISYSRTCIDSNSRYMINDFLTCTDGEIFNISKLLGNISILKTLSDFSIYTESVLASKSGGNFPALPPVIAPKDFIKDVLSIRVALLSKIVDFLKIEGFHDETFMKQLFSLIFEDVIMAVKLARDSNRGSEANNLLHALESFLSKIEQYLPCNFALESNFKIKIENAKVKFLQKDFQTCFSLLNHNSISLDLNQFPEIYCYLLTLYGTFLGEKQQETSLNIISHYLEKSVNILRKLKYDSPSLSQIKLLVKAHYSLAQYTDKQYNLIVEYLESPEYGTKLKLAHTFEQMGKLDLGTSENTVTVNRAQLPLQKSRQQANRHASEYRQHTSELAHDKSEFLKKSLESYCNCLGLSDTHDMSISRVISLWFDNSENPVISQVLTNHFSNINTRKFIPWAFQIISRLSFIANGVNSSFSNTLTALILRITRDHPYHCLPIIFAILHSPLDSIPGKTYSYGELSECMYKLDQIYSNSPLQNIVEIIMADKGEIVQRMKHIFIDLIDLGYHNHNLSKSNVLPRNCSLLIESKLRDIPLFTLEIPVRHDNDYSSLVTIAKFNSKYYLPGGVSRPKLLTCLGSDGKNYKILLKGREDLRKDAVIQQAFTVINQLLARDKWFSERCIAIRTYKIVPLSQGSGLISWCEGAVSLADYLINNSSGAHQRYYPNDEKSERCQQSYTAAPNKLKSYQAICERFHPVFRFFFFEKFLDAPTWLQRRIQYTRCMAVSSMAGYILGIGDRHTENILIDTSTAEIIHIDFGELFDSGKLLSVPEMVPFRLTRDLVDPMGDLGKDGIFRPCCEETLRIIRISKEYIKTVLKVLLYAPLNKWEVIQNCIKSSLARQSCQSAQFSPVKYSPSLSLGGEDANEIALQVLLRINEKIDGIERRTPLSISGQVNLLISEATDEVNLSSMFHGWKPWI